MHSLPRFLPRFLPLFLPLMLPLVLVTPVTAQECTHYAAPGGPSIAQFWGQAYPGATLCLQDGTYTGWDQMLTPPPGLRGTEGAPITVRAVNDGGVVIDGQYRDYPFFLDNVSYLVFAGMDVGNGATSVIYFLDNVHHIVVRRVCAYNANLNPRPGATGTNNHTILHGGSFNLFEDVCTFGWGRNSYVDGNGTGNVIRRMWAKWEGGLDGWEANSGGPEYQFDYSVGRSTGHDTIYENLIGVYSSEKTPGNSGVHNLGWATRTGLQGAPQGAPGNLFAGHLIYGYDDAGQRAHGSPNGSWVYNRWSPNRAQDLFIDGRSQPQAGPFMWGCDLYISEGNPGQGDCGRAPADRITILQTSGQGANYVDPHPSRTNIQTCTEMNGCPNLFTGQGGSGPGARLCGRYVGGTYTQEPLWPWPMDSRIKWALERGGSRGLSGDAGPGYEAGTVTSEVVARYGPVPPDCQGTPVVVEPPMPLPRNLRARVRD